MATTGIFVEYRVYLLASLAGERDRDGLTAMPTSVCCNAVASYNAVRHVGQYYGAVPLQPPELFAAFGVRFQIGFDQTVVYRIDHKVSGAAISVIAQDFDLSNVRAPRSKFNSKHGVSYRIDLGSWC